MSDDLLTSVVGSHAHPGWFDHALAAAERWASTDYATALSLGDFTTLMLDINPNLVATGFGSYPTTWTQFTINIPVSGTGRVGFRYFVTNGGPSGTNGNFIGIDSLNIVAVPEPASVGLLAIIGAGLVSRRRR